MRTWWYIVRIIRATAPEFTAALAAAIGYFGLPLLLGLATQAVFDALSGEQPAGLNFWSALALLVVLELLRSGILGMFGRTWINLRYAGSGLLRANVFRQVLAGPAAMPLPDSPGEAISRLRDDAESIMFDALDAWIDLAGRSIFAIAAFVVMFRINAPLALAVAAMLALSVPIIALAGDRIALYGRLNHEAIGRVTGFLAETFGGVQAIKAAGATDSVITHFQMLGERRRKAAVRDQLWQAAVTAIDANVVTFGTGLILLVAGQAIRSGTFTVGDFSLFVVYLADLMWFPDEIARWITSYRQAGVSLSRLAHLIGDADPRTLVEPLPGDTKGRLADSSYSEKPVATRKDFGETSEHVGRTTSQVHAVVTGEPPLPASPSRLSERSRPVSGDWPATGAARVGPDDQPRGRDVPLERLGEVGGVPLERFRLPSGFPLLEVQALTYRFPHSGRGIEDVSLSIRSGSFVAITGRVAAGKTTLLQVLLGLLLRQSGSILWKGAPVTNPTSLFGPPRTSYVPQTPRLFSQTLRANVEEGLESSDAVLAQALRLAMLDRDLAEFPDGWDTLIGPRGARLSGGQIQRTAAARAFIREPELLVLDDLSSALDLPTEEQLWERIAEWRRAAPGLTIMAVSHRNAALSRADRVLTLEEGKLVD